jgi:hypothetical protein
MGIYLLYYAALMPVILISVTLSAMFHLFTGVLPPTELNDSYFRVATGAARPPPWTSWPSLI